MNKKLISFLAATAMIVSMTREPMALVKSDVVTNNINIEQKKTESENNKSYEVKGKVYNVSNNEELKEKLETIRNSTDEEATIELTGNITNGNFVGVADKEIMIKSADGQEKYSIGLGSELVGNVTFDNVKVYGETLYCSGYKTIFTKNSELTLTGTLYGGGYQSTVESTYVKVNGKAKINTSDMENVVIGGSYKGSVEGDIYIELAGDITYGTNVGGNYLAATNKATAYGGDRYDGDPLYVGGDVTLILDSSNMNTQPQNVIGAYNSHVKGNVTVQAKAGYFNGINGMREDSNQAIVDKDIHIIAGDPAYENTDSICRLNYNWDITGAGEQINNSGLFQVKGNVIIDTYENLWGWDKNGEPDYDPAGIVGVDSAVVEGDVTINVNGSHIEDITGLDESLVSGSTLKGNLTINAINAELKDKDNTSYIYPISDGTIEKNATINMDGGQVTEINCSVGETIGNTTVNITGEPKFTSEKNGVWGQEVDENSSNDKSVLNIDNAKTKIPIVGYFSEMNVKNNSDVTLGNDKNNAFTVYDVNINTGAKLITNKQAYSKGALTMDNGEWIANGYLYVTEDTNTTDSKITMNDYAAFGYGYKADSTHDKNVVTSNNDIYTFNNNSLIDKIYGNADITSSTWNVLVPTIISGNYKGTTNKLSLPAFVDKENYPDEKIPLEIVGEATGTTDVTLVDKTDITKEGKPIVGQNYINGLKTSEKVFRLANENAKPENLYFKKVVDADTQNKANYDMWQVAKGDSLTLDYKFVSDDNNQTELPEVVLEEVKQFEEEKNHHDGDIIKIDELNKEIKDKDVEVANGTWYFKGWAYKENENSKYEYIEEHKIEMHKNIELVGVWHFEPNSTGGGGGGTIVTPPTDPDRIEGNDRIETSVETSKDLYPNGTNAVVLANCERYTDVLTADPFAIQEKASALLTYKYEIPEKTLKEIERLGAKKIYISGGYDAVSKKVVDELAAKGYEIFRFDGVDRYDTARKIAIKIREKGNTNAAELASGEDFPDALCMTPLAVKDHAPILLTKKDSIPKYTKQALAEWDIENIKIGGLEKAVSPEVEKQLKAGFEIEKNNKKDSNVYDGAKAVKRIGGEDRYETSAKLAKESYPDSKLGVYATGEDFPDALIAGNYAGTKEAPVLLVKGDSLPEPIEKYTKESKIKRATIIGGVNAVSDKVFNLIKAIINR